MKERKFRECSQKSLSAAIVRSCVESELLRYTVICHTYSTFREMERVSDREVVISDTDHSCSDAL